MPSKKKILARRVLFIPAMAKPIALDALTVRFQASFHAIGSRSWKNLMLVLTRKKTESIKIGNDIVITVIQTGKGTVRLGIQAPANVRVLRGELAPFPTTTTPAADDSHVDAEDAALDRFLAELNDLLGTTDAAECVPLVAEAAL